jgi:hypothetical protein
LAPNPLHISTIRSVLLQAWGNPKGMVIRSPGTNQFLAEFACQADKDRVLGGSPWHISKSGCKGGGTARYAATPPRKKGRSGATGLTASPLAGRSSQAALTTNIPQSGKSLFSVKKPYLSMGKPLPAAAQLHRP